jgi:hypothetical protein
VEERNPQHRYETEFIAAGFEVARVEERCRTSQERVVEPRRATLRNFNGVASLCPIENRNPYTRRCGAIPARDVGILFAALS